MQNLITLTESSDVPLGAIPYSHTESIAGGTVAIAENVLFAIWYGAPDPSAIDVMHRVVGEIRRKHERFGCITIVDDGATVPNRELRSAFSKAWQDLEPAGVATVMLSSGIVATIGKTIMSAIALMSSNRDTFRSFSTLREGALWLSPRCGQSPGRLLTTAIHFRETILAARRSG